MSQIRRRETLVGELIVIYSTSPYTLEQEDTVLINGSAAGTHTLPPLSGATLVTVRVKNVGSGDAVVVGGASTDTIDGLSALVLAPNEFATLLADQSDRPGEWFLV